ncbi:MAG: hypothetical protein IPO40_12155 [Fibrobacteres bacterium]|nr:hypothetical protein [Fibrobacterota bacterium]
MEEFPASTPEEIERRLADWREEKCAWRQGDCVLQPFDFLWLTDARNPLTEAGKGAVAGGADVAGQTFPGAVVLTQTCDIVRSWDKRPFLEVAPLIEVDAAQFEQIRKGKQPGYLFIPALSGSRLVGNLSQPMTVEKSVVAGWQRVPGWEFDQDGQNLSRSIIRRLERFAFPDDIVQMYDKWECRIKGKHGKASPEGQLLDRLLEIRVEAKPSWDAKAIEVTFLCIRPEDSKQIESQVIDQIPSWETMIEKPSRVTKVEFTVEPLSSLSALRYLSSARMDFDHLSARNASLGDRIAT